MANIIRFLKEYRVYIIYMIVLFAIIFWFKPAQERLYLPLDFDAIEKSSSRFLLYTLSAGFIVCLFFVVRHSKTVKQGLHVTLGIGVLCLSIYLFFQAVVLAAFLLLNRIEFRGTQERKYVSKSYWGPEKRELMIYDFRLDKRLYLDNVQGQEKLANVKEGDTVIISFDTGLLGFPFNPRITKIRRQNYARSVQISQ